MDMDDSDWYSAEVYVRGTNLQLQVHQLLQQLLLWQHRLYGSKRHPYVPHKHRWDWTKNPPRQPGEKT